MPERSANSATSADTKRLCRLAVAALARRDHTRFELHQKLLQKLLPGETEQTLSLALDRVAELGYLNEQRAAESLVRQGQPRFGQARLRLTLLGKGLSRELVNSVLPPASTELQRARMVWQKRFGTLPQDMRERARQSRFLAARGFAPSTIARVLKADDDDGYAS